VWAHALARTAVANLENRERIPRRLAQVMQQQASERAEVLLVRGACPELAEWVAKTSRYRPRVLHLASAHALYEPGGRP
jgi:hypothetical protein